MNWLKKKIRNWLNDSGDALCRGNEAKISTDGIASGGSLNSDATLNFTVYNAIGGKVVEFRRYDRIKDRSDNSMYVIGKDEDFGEKISKIATLEVMK